MFEDVVMRELRDVLGDHPRLEEVSQRISEAVVATIERMLKGATVDDRP